jgi:hypothetical protein
MVSSPSGLSEAMAAGSAVEGEYATKYQRTSGCCMKPTLPLKKVKEEDTQSR